MIFQRKKSDLSSAVPENDATGSESDIRNATKSESTAESIDLSSVVAGFVGMSLTSTNQLQCYLRSIDLDP